MTALPNGAPCISLFSLQLMRQTEQGGDLGFDAAETCVQELEPPPPPISSVEPF